MAQNSLSSRLDKIERTIKAREEANGIRWIEIINDPELEPGEAEISWPGPRLGDSIDGPSERFRREAGEDEAEFRQRVELAARRRGTDLVVVGGERSADNFGSQNLFD